MMRSKEVEVGRPRGEAGEGGGGGAAAEREAKLQRELQKLQRGLQVLKKKVEKKEKKANKDHDGVMKTDPQPMALSRQIEEQPKPIDDQNHNHNYHDHDHDHNHNQNGDHNQDPDRHHQGNVEEPQQPRPEKRAGEEKEDEEAKEGERDQEGKKKPRKRRTRREDDEEEEEDEERGRGRRGENSVEEEQDSLDFLLSPVFKPKTKRPRIEDPQQPKAEVSLDDIKDFSFDESIGHSQGVLKEIRVEVADGDSQVERLVESSLEENQAHYWSNHSLPPGEDRDLGDTHHCEESPPHTPEQPQTPEADYVEEATQTTPLQETQAAPSQTNFELDFRTLANHLKNCPVSPYPHESESPEASSPKTNTPGSSHKGQTQTQTQTPQRPVSSSPPASPSPAMTPLVATQLAATQPEGKNAPCDLDGLFTKLKASIPLMVKAERSQTESQTPGMSSVGAGNSAAAAPTPQPSSKGNLGRVPIFNFSGPSPRRANVVTSQAASAAFSMTSNTPNQPRPSPSSLSKGTFASPVSPQKPFVALTVDPASPLPTLTTTQHPSRPFLGPTPSKGLRPAFSPITKVQVFSPKQKKPLFSPAPPEKLPPAPPISLVRCLRHRGPVEAVQLSPSSKKLSVCLANSIRVYDTETWSSLVEITIPAHPGRTASMHWIPEGETSFIVSLAAGDHNGERILGTLFSLLPESKPLDIYDSTLMENVDQASPSPFELTQSLLFPGLRCFLAISPFSGMILKTTFDSNWGEILTRDLVARPPGIRSARGAHGSLSCLEGGTSQFLWITSTHCFLGDASSGTLVRTLDFTKILSPKQNLVVSCPSVLEMSAQKQGNNCHAKPFAATLRVVDGAGLLSLVTVAVHGDKMVQLNSVTVGSFSGPAASDNNVLCVASNPSTVKLFSLSTMKLNAVFDTSAGIPQRGVVKCLQVQGTKPWIVVGTEDGCVHLYSFPAIV